MRFLALAVCLLVLLHLEPSELTLACAIGCAMALLWLSYQWLKEAALVAAFALHLALSDAERPWVF